MFQVVRRDAAEAMEAEVGLHPAVVRRGVRSEDGGAGPPSTLPGLAWGLVSALRSAGVR